MPHSQAQVRAAHATLQGQGKTDMPRRVADEIVEKMHGRKLSSLPKKAKNKGRFKI